MVETKSNKIKGQRGINVLKELERIAKRFHVDITGVIVDHAERATFNFAFSKNPIEEVRRAIVLLGQTEGVVEKPVTEPVVEAPKAP